jgi:hypothetical protein
MTISHGRPGGGSSARGCGSRRIHYNRPVLIEKMRPPMLKAPQFWILTGAALIAALLALANATLFGSNRARQAEIAERAQYVQQSVQLEGLYREIVKGLADLSVRTQDPALARLLASQGITVTANPAPASGLPTPAAKGAR